MAVRFHPIQFVCTVQYSTVSRRYLRITYVYFRLLACPPLRRRGVGTFLVLLLDLHAPLQHLRRVRGLVPAPGGSRWGRAGARLGLPEDVAGARCVSVGAR